MPQINNKYDRTHLRNMALMDKRIKRIYSKAAEEAAKIGVSLRSFNPDKVFTFDDYPETKKMIDKLTKSLHDSMETAVVSGVRSSWTLSNNKNNALSQRIFGDNVGRLTKEQYARYFSNNSDALDAFLLRKQNGLNLSDRVWRYTNDFRNEIEMGLDLGIRSGKDAPSMARELKQYLQYPDKLFRRVRDEHGQLQLSKAAAEFHPGRGVYRSSYKNARRLASTEINMAYRTSDYLRWQQLDFVVGIEVKTSNNHTLLGSDGKPHEFLDICDALAGKYPKDFKFTGWHPHCRCHAEPILKTEKEMDEDTDRILNGEDTTNESVNKVEDVPQAFKDHIVKYADTIKAVDNARLPYYVQDNRVRVDDVLGIGEPIKINTVENNTYIAEITVERLSIPDISYIKDDISKNSVERLSDAATNLENLYGHSNKDWNAAETSVQTCLKLKSEPLSKMCLEQINKGWITDKSKPCLEAMNHVGVIKSFNASTLPNTWQEEFNTVIKRINIVDLKKDGFISIYPDIEHAYNMIRLSQNKEAIAYGLERISTKMPYNLLTEYQKKIPFYTLGGDIPPKAFWDCQKTFTPLVSITSESSSYFSPYYRYVNIPLTADNVRDFTDIAYYRSKILYHEFGHSIDHQLGLRSNKEIQKIYNEWKKIVKADDAKNIEAEINKQLKKYKTAKVDAKKLFDKGALSKEKYEVYVHRVSTLKKNAVQQLGALSDCAGAAIDGKRFIQPRGHSEIYFQDYNLQLAEFIAHSSETYWGGNEQLRRIDKDLYEAMRSLISKFVVHSK